MPCQSIDYPVPYTIQYPLNHAYNYDINFFQLPELSEFKVGLMHIQLLHTSASLAINENWDPDVRDDMEMMLNRIVPEDLPFRHSCEGPDDMVSARGWDWLSCVL